MDFSRLKVLCVGDVMLDRFVYGDIERISPEAPVPVVRNRRTREMLGGAGNVASNVVALGGQVVLVGLVGEDPAGRLIGSILADLAGAEAALVASAVRPTTCKTRVIAANQQVMRLDDESQAPLGAADRQALAESALRWMSRVDAVILSDYAKGVLSPALIAMLTDVASRTGVPVFVDPKSADFARYRGARCIKPNLKELALAAGGAIEDEADLVAAARRLLADAAAEAILVTRSSRGMTLVTHESVHTVAARAREVFDVSGAGDTVIAALTLANASGRSLAQATNIANAAASVVVSKLGTATASMDEVLAELSREDAPAGARVLSGLRSVEEARELAWRWRQQGMAVGFTNGCFDVLHAGHVASLAHALASCDRLIVALNTDAGVRRLKGAGRPLNALALRARVMAALRDVDCVVAFEEETPLELIRTLMPDVLVKGADYAAADVVGGDLVRAAGGRVVLTPLVEGLSTTRLIARMQEDARPEIA